MKTVQINATKEVMRLPDWSAEQMVSSSEARYVPKSKWKDIQKSKLRKEKDEKADRNQ